MSFFVLNYSINFSQGFVLIYAKEIAKIGSEIYSQRKSPDKAGSFGHWETEGVNRPALF